MNRATLIETNVLQPVGLAVHGSYVYWIDRESRNVMKIREDDRRGRTVQAAIDDLSDMIVVDTLNTSGVKVLSFYTSSLWWFFIIQVVINKDCVVVFAGQYVGWLWGLIRRTGRRQRQRKEKLRFNKPNNHFARITSFGAFFTALCTTGPLDYYMQCDVGMGGLIRRCEVFLSLCELCCGTYKQSIGKYANIWLECGVKVERPEIHVIRGLVTAVQYFV